MKALLTAHGNPYSLHHEMLRRQVLAAAAVDEAKLYEAGVELTEGWIADEACQPPSDCCTYITAFDALKRLHILDKLSDYRSYSVVTTMRRSDVFFALAFLENEAAHYSFSANALWSGWHPADAMQRALDAAVSAANSYMFGLFLKEPATEVQWPPNIPFGMKRRYVQ